MKKLFFIMIFGLILFRFSTINAMDGGRSIERVDVLDVFVVDRAGPADDLVRPDGVGVRAFDPALVEDVVIDIDSLRRDIARRESERSSVDSAERALGELEGGFALDEEMHDFDEGHLVDQLCNIFVRRGVGLDLDAEVLRRKCERAIGARMSVKRDLESLCQKKKELTAKKKGISLPDDFSETVGQAVADLSMKAFSEAVTFIMKDHEEQTKRADDESVRADKESARADKETKKSTCLTISNTVTPIVSAILAAAVTAGVDYLLTYIFGSDGSASGGGNFTAT